MKSVFLSKFRDSSVAHAIIFLGILTSNLLLTSLAQAEEKRNDAGVAIQFGNSTNFGIQGKIGLSDNFSIRPEIFFGGGSPVENTAFQTTRLFKTPVDFTTPAGFSTPAITLPGNFTTGIPLTLPNAFTTTTAFTIGAAFTTNVPITVGGTTFPAGSTIPLGATVPAGTFVPAGFSLPVGAVIPAGTPIPSQSIPTGTKVPAGSEIPVGTGVPASVIGSRLSGTSFGLAATYDFKLDPQGKSTAYVGPKLSFSSASGPATFNGNDIQGSNIDVSETKIGLVAGADYGISDNFTIGANVTYNLSRSVNSSGSINFLGLPDVSTNVRPAGSSLDFGLRASYRF
jgi:Opacity family porin protein